ncbi:MAG: glycogen-binding domain-containing protein [Gemmatimonadetes bacterium]|nr:glycogen-binding domain-containing protein [Gemmatimonadota bacterium]
MDALAGRYRYENSPVGGTSGSALLGLRYLRGASGLSALAGVPLTSADAPWGDLAGLLRLTAAAHPLEWGLRLSGQAFAQGAHGDTAVASMPTLPGAARDIPLNRRGVVGGGVEPILGGWGASGEITPLVAYATPSWSIQGRGGIAGFHSSFADQSFDRLLRVAYLRVSHVLSPNLVLSAEERTQWAQEATYPYLGATALLTSGSVEAWASLGTWLTSGVRTAPWALEARIHVRDRLSITGSVRRDAFDALFETPARTSWSFGVSVALARPSAIAAPIPQRYDDGVATIGLSASDAKGSVLIAGDFNDWKPQPMKMKHGYWTAQIALPPGVYYYAFVDGDGSWFVPQSVAGRKPDGFGGYVAVLVVG